jgi:hypothetical protein
MTKNEKKNLIWRLKDQPTAEGIARLVETGVISSEQGYEILINESQTTKKELAAKEEEIKFLRELVDTLANKNNGWTTIVKEYRDYRPHYPTWYASYSPIINTITSPAIYATSGYVATGASGGTGSGSTSTSFNSGLFKDKDIMASASSAVLTTSNNKINYTGLSSLNKK